MKKLILSLFMLLVGIINFGYCYEGGRVGNLTLSSHQIYEVGKGNTNVISMGDNLTFCMISNNLNNPCNFTAVYGDYTVSITPTNKQYIACIPNVTVSNSVGVTATNNTSSSCNGMYIFFPTDSVVPPLTSLQCQTQYSLIPIENVDQNYCTTNGLCPTNECTGGTSSGTNWSALYINNIQKPGSPLINITIPEEIQRDEYYDSGESNIDIIGYGYDQNKMQQMVNTQYYKPTAEEMSGLIEKIADFLPFIAVALLITRIRRVIKKVFRF